LFPDVIAAGPMRNLRRRRDLIRQRKITADFQMARHLAEDRLNRPGGAPLKVAIVVAVFGVLSMLIIDYGPWSKPKVQPAFMVSYSSTDEAARAAGAQVMPTEQKLQVEPEPPVPKPVHPVNPPAR
jgi:hypothetical protein